MSLPDALAAAEHHLAAIGLGEPDRALTGTLDEAAVFPTMLSAAQFASLYAARSTVASATQPADGGLHLPRQQPDRSVAC